MSNLVPKTRKYRRIKFLPSDFTRNERNMLPKVVLSITDAYFLVRVCRISLVTIYILQDARLLFATA